MDGTEEQRSRELSTQQWLDIGRQAVDAGMIYLLITGGEPFLRPDFLQIYTDMVRRGVKISINTNGTCVTSQILEVFRQYPPEQVNVTLYGTSAETYQDLCGAASGYEAAKQGVRMLKQAGVRVNLNTTFTQRNARDLEDLVAFAKEEKLPIRTAAYVFPKVRNDGGTQDVSLSPKEHGALSARFDALTLSDQQLAHRKEAVARCVAAKQPENDGGESKASSCMAGRGAFWVTWDGLLYPCGMIPQGVNVIERPFAHAWNEICKEMEQVYLPVECSSCPYRVLCPVCAALCGSLGASTTEVPLQMCEYIHAYCEAFLSD